MLRALLVLKLLKCPTPDGGHLGFVQYGRHRGSPSWLPREIGRIWLYLPLVQKWCLWNDLNNYLIKPPDYRSYYSLRNFGFSYPGVNSDVKAYLWKSVCPPTLSYGCETINMNKSNIKNLETCQGNIISLSKA